MKFFRRRKKQKFDSGEYWRRRYEDKKTSGPGSYGRLAAYKADIVNGILRDRGISSVIEFGCGDGNQAALFEIPNYTGVDISPLVVENAKKTFADRPGWTFQVAGEGTVADGAHDMSMSLDVIYHLIEDDVFETYMHNLVAAARRYVLVFASDYEQTAKPKHVRHRHYSEWLAQNYPELKMVQEFEHPYPASEGSDITETSFAHFKIFEKANKPD